MKKPQFAEDQYYHLYNRGVEKRDVFMDQKDYYRFIHDLYEFNDESSVVNVSYRFNPQTMEVEPQYFLQEKNPRKLLVEILAFVLMPNHFHLLVKQKKEKGIVRFMQKLGTGYTMYFNKKYERVGSLFQGRFKAVLVNNERHFNYLPSYIHLNPIKKYRGSTSIDDQMRFLREYRWSSYPDYIGVKNFPSVTSRGFLSDVFCGQKNYAVQVKNLLKSKQNFNDISEVLVDDDF